MPIIDGAYVTDKYYAWLEAEKESERLRRKYRQLRNNLQAIENKTQSLQKNLNNLEKELEELLIIDEKIFESEEYNNIKKQVNSCIKKLKT